MKQAATGCAAACFTGCAAGPRVFGTVLPARGAEGLSGGAPWCFCWHAYRWNRLRRRELPTTRTELSAMAAPAMMGFSSPRAAMGIPMVL